MKVATSAKTGLFLVLNSSSNVVCICVCHRVSVVSLPGLFLIIRLFNNAGYACAILCDGSHNQAGFGQSCSHSSVGTNTASVS